MTYPIDESRIGGSETPTSSGIINPIPTVNTPTPQITSPYGGDMPVIPPINNPVIDTDADWNRDTDKENRAITGQTLEEYKVSPVIVSQEVRDILAKTGQTFAEYTA